jgi:hypothetical protein
MKSPITHETPQIGILNAVREPISTWRSKMGRVVHLLFLNFKRHFKMSNPMDLICSELPNDVFTVRLPNPRHPKPAPPLVYYYVKTDARYGPAWGYGGAGPLNLALNVMVAYLPGNDFPDCDEYGKRFSRAAWRAHHDFTKAFLVTMPRCGRTVTEDEIRAWLLARS